VDGVPLSAEERGALAELLKLVLPLVEEWAYHQKGQPQTAFELLRGLEEFVQQRGLDPRQVWSVIFRLEKAP
jgi:hypothetical protein